MNIIGTGVAKVNQLVCAFPDIDVGASRRWMHFHPHDWMWATGERIAEKVEAMLEFADGYFTDIVCDAVSWPGCIYESDYWTPWDERSRPNGMHLYDYLLERASEHGISVHIRFPITFVSTYDELINPFWLHDEWRMSDTECAGSVDQINLSQETCREWIIEVWLNDFLANNALPAGIHWNFEPKYEYRDCPLLDPDQFTDVLARARAVMNIRAQGVEHWGATMTRSRENDLEHFRDPLSWLPYVDYIKQGNYGHSASERVEYALEVGADVVKPGIGTDGVPVERVAEQIDDWKEYGFSELFAFVYGERSGNPRFTVEQRNAFGPIGTRDLYISGMIFTME